MNALSRHDGSGPFIGENNLLNLLFGPFFVYYGGSEVSRVEGLEGEAVVTAECTVGREMLHEDDQRPLETE